MTAPDSPGAPAGAGSVGAALQHPGAEAHDPGPQQLRLRTPMSPPPGRPSAGGEVIIPKGEGATDKARKVRRKAGRPPVPTDRRILEAVLKFHAEGHPWPRLRERLEPISKKYGGPYPLSTEQARRLARKAARILGNRLKTRHAGRRYDYYRQIDNAGGAWG